MLKGYRFSRTGVSLRRVEPGVYEVYARCPFRLTMAGQGLQISTDQKIWQAVGGKVAGANVEFRIDEAVLDIGKCRFLLRVR